jgi:hypothetical protein
MSTLQERLDRIREGFLQQAPESVVSVMSRATADLRASGITSRIPAVGDPLPAFELPDTEGRPMRSADLIAEGPLVLTVYRGLW